MLVIRGVLLGCLVLVLTGCGSSKPKDMIVGKWKSKEKMGPKEVEATYEFTSDGKLKLGMGPISFEAKYKFVDDNNFEIEMTPPGETKAEVTKVKIESITKEKMVTSSEKAANKEFTRAN